MGHEERSHSLLSASGAYRWSACPPSAMLEAGLPDTSSEAAREGTLAHELAEMKLRNYFYSLDFGKRKLSAAVKKLKEHPSWNDEMMGYTDDYLDYVKKVAIQFPADPTKKIEERVYFGKYTCAELTDPTGEKEEGYGTADCILISGNVIHVIDFKYGKSPEGRVEARDNPQMILYALGAYEACRLLYPVEKVRMSIVQPRIPDGISEWEIPLGQLLEEGAYLRGRAELAVNGTGCFAPGPKTCRYCRARNRCRARAEKNIELAFAPVKGKLPPLISNEEMGKYLLQGQDVARWLSDLQEAALAECLKGNEVPGWKAVEGRGSRKWTDMDEAFLILQEKGISEVLLWEKKPLTLAQVEKLVGKKDFSEYVGQYVVKEAGKPALVQESDKRPAVTNVVTAEEAFDITGKGEENHE